MFLGNGDRRSQLMLALRAFTARPSAFLLVPICLCCHFCKTVSKHFDPNCVVFASCSFQLGPPEPLENCTISNLTERGFSVECREDRLSGSHPSATPGTATLAAAAQRPALSNRGQEPLVYLLEVYGPPEGTSLQRGVSASQHQVGLPPRSDGRLPSLKTVLPKSNVAIFFIKELPPVLWK